MWAESVSFDFVCSTATPFNSAEDDSNGPLPKGVYFVGDARTYHPVDWFELFPQRDDLSGVWDYNTNSDENYCRGGFGFHEGSRSAGCITVKGPLDATGCFEQVKNFVTSLPKSLSPNRYECSKCFLGKCWNGISKMTSLSLYNMVVLSR